MEDPCPPQLDVLLTQQGRVIEMAKVDFGTALTRQSLRG